MENLNNDVLGNILYRLPLGVASSQAKRVCKSWKTILDERRHNEVGFLLLGYYSKESKFKFYFGEEYDHIDVNKRENYYSPETLMVMREHCRFSFKPFQFDGIQVGSCNGLVCFKKKELFLQPSEPFAISNSLTGEYIFLKSFGRVWKFDALVSTGFGYCQSTDEYKVVRINSRIWRRPHVQVYTIGSNKWRERKTSIDDYRFRAYGPGIFANNVLHWVVDVGGRVGVAAFDLEDEKFRELPLPPPEVIEHGRNELKLLGGNLCWVKSNYNMTHIYIWVYKRKNVNTNNSTRHGMEKHDQKLDYYSETSWNWVKEFNIECGRFSEPFAITKSNEVLLLCGGDLYCYDPKTRTLSKLGNDNGIECSYVEAIPHANSYVSLKDFGETWYGPGCSPGNPPRYDVYYPR